MALIKTFALTRRALSTLFLIPRRTIQPLQLRGIKIERPSDDAPWRKAEKCKEETSKCPPRSDNMYETLKNNKNPTKQQFETCIAPTVKPLVPRQCPPPEPQPRRPRKPDMAAATTACGNAARKSAEPDASIAKIKDRCIKVLSEFCPPVRQPTTCIKHKLPAECTRIAAPFASFHECTKPTLLPLSMNECRCLERKPPCIPQLADR